MVAAYRYSPSAAPWRAGGKFMWLQDTPGAMSSADPVADALGKGQAGAGLRPAEGSVLRTPDY